MFYIGLASGSKNFLVWIKKELHKKLDINGHITSTKKKNTYYQLKYAKKEALAIIEKIYYNPNVVCLSRKYKKIIKTIDINKKQQIAYLTN